MFNKPQPNDSVSTVAATEVDFLLPTKQAEFPDGGLRAWATVFAAWLVQFSTFGYINSFGVYQDYYVRIYLNECTASQISWIGSVQLFLVLGSGIFTGVAFDRGYYYHLMIGGTVIFTVSLFSLSFSSPQHYYQVFLADGVGVGIAAGLIFIPSMSIISHYFKGRRTLALGITSSGSSLGGMLHPIMLNHLFHGSVGFRNGVRASAVLNFILLVIAILLTRTRLPPSRSVNFFSNVGSYVRDLPYVFMVIGASLVILGLYITIFSLQLMTIMNGISPSSAFYMITIMNGANVIGRVIPNMLAHRYGVFTVIVPSIASCGILTLSMLAIKDVAGMIVFAVLFGFFSGAYTSLFLPVVASLTEDVSEIGSRWGVSLFVAGIVSLGGLSMAGSLLSDKFLWWRPVTFAGLSVLIGLIAFATSGIMAELRRRRKETCSI